MAGIVSVRFTRDERASIRQRAREGGFPSMSAFIRVRLGFDPHGGIEPSLEYEELDSPALLRTVASMVDRLDDVRLLLRQICRAQGLRPEVIDTPRQPVAPVAPPDANGHMDIPDPQQLTTKVMPVGFER